MARHMDVFIGNTMQVVMCLMMVVISMAIPLHRNIYGFYQGLHLWHNVIYYHDYKVYRFVGPKSIVNADFYMPMDIIHIKPVHNKCIQREMHNFYVYNHSFSNNIDISGDINAEYSVSWARSKVNINHY